MGLSVSNSKVVSIKPSLCCHNGCLHCVAEGHIYCTLHDVNPMFPKKKGKPVQYVIEKKYSCCLPFLCMY